ncbi:unnamed protein product [Didymodactylos carnosus]|uniref:Ketimine reductase mu-crystallin n=1 Tax=Didymodactylos carnosus TaxID=1234261 RepID=A0A814A107_9BILA|nr:unnamed protein product [Didymodactylos carnosus]CAF0907140.1 unnamed protein product [Didymodactylos carnosus]CAF3634771.1 unnamed protein product [Didymodactylos carnosus]CAF3688722.1 unnamed protein product [Didymodactylos carnosus]
MKFFNHKQIQELMPMNKCIETMEKMFEMFSNNIDHTYFSFPVRTALHVPQSLIPKTYEKQISILGYMPSFANLSELQLNMDFKSFIATKIITVYMPSENTHLGLVLLFEAINGHLIGLFDAKTITSIRTAACSAVAAKYLLDITNYHHHLNIAIIGNGEQARMHTLALAYAFISTNLFLNIIITGRNEIKLNNCVIEIQKLLNDNKLNKRIDVKYSINIEQTVYSSNLICTVTSSQTPILNHKWVKHDTVIIAVGACKSTFREIDSDLVRDSILIVDHKESALKEAGDILIPISEGIITETHIFCELGDIITKKKILPKTNSNIILFKSLGLAIEDLMTCVQIYSDALKYTDSTLFYTLLNVDSICTQNVIEDIYPFPQLHHIYNAQKTIENISKQTPLVLLNDSNYANMIYLKLENLQPIGSYKLRPAANVLLGIKEKNLDMFDHIQKTGVVTCSAGNFAQGIAYVCKQLNIPCTIIIPSHAPEIKRNAILRINNQVQLVTMEMNEYWNTFINEKYKENESLYFISPGTNPYCMAGNGTIALEILQQLPKSVPLDKLVVLVPYGGGAMTLGICIALKSINPNIQVYACEVETAAPLYASLNAGKPTEIVYNPSFVDGIGAKEVLPNNFYKLKQILNGSLVVSLKDVSHALKLLVERNHVVAEGAGATSVAVALKYFSSIFNQKVIVCVISGGNIDTVKLIQVLTDNL